MADTRIVSSLCAVLINFEMPNNEMIEKVSSQGRQPSEADFNGQTSFSSDKITKLGHNTSTSVLDAGLFRDTR